MWRFWWFWNSLYALLFLTITVQEGPSTHTYIKHFVDIKVKDQSQTHSTHLLKCKLHFDVRKSLYATLWAAQYFCPLLKWKALLLHFPLKLSTSWSPRDPSLPNSGSTSALLSIVAVNFSLSRESKVSLSGYSRGGDGAFTTHLPPKWSGEERVYEGHAVSRDSTVIPALHW